MSNENKSNNYEPNEDNTLENYNNEIRKIKDYIEFNSIGLNKAEKELADLKELYAELTNSNKTLCEKIRLFFSGEKGRIEDLIYMLQAQICKLKKAIIENKAKLITTQHELFETIDRIRGLKK
jgi:hypothetical protein